MTTPPKHQIKCAQHTYPIRKEESSATALRPYRTDLQQRLQHRLLQETHHTLQKLQEMLAAMEELLLDLQERQDQLRNITETQPKESSNRQRLRATGLCLKCRRKGLTRECPRHDTPPDRLEAEEYRQRRKQGLCFKCREKGLAWQCLRHDQPNQQHPPRHLPFQGHPQHQDSTPRKDEDESNKTQENSDNELEEKPTRQQPTSKGKGRRTCSLSSHRTTSSEQ